MIPAHEFERAQRRASVFDRASTHGREDKAVKMQTMQTDEVTITEIVFVSGFDGQGFVGTGSAKRAPGDTGHWEVGARYAAGRAFIELGIRLIQDAQNRVVIEEATK